MIDHQVRSERKLAKGGDDPHRPKVAVTFEPELFDAIRNYAAARRISFGRALRNLARAGLLRP